MKKKITRDKLAKILNEEFLKETQTHIDLSYLLKSDYEEGWPKEKHEKYKKILKKVAKRLNKLIKD